MKATAVCILVIALAATPTQVLGQGGAILLFSDNPGFSECTLTETVFATNYVYVVHVWMAEANTVSGFWVDVDWPNAIVGPVSYANNLHLGDIYSDVAITYVGCKPLPHLLAVLEFIPTSTTPLCGGRLEVRGLGGPFPEPTRRPEVIDCDGNIHDALGGRFTVNPAEFCAPHHVGWCGQVETEPTTWGKVKALYQ